jgi:ABC-2 type transport system ATP-binding protein
MMGAPDALQIHALKKRYAGGVQALDDVSLTIPPGMFGLLGPNGAGKSTLMRTLATLQDPDEGTVRLGDIDILRDKDATRLLLGYLPQDFGLYPKVSAEDMLDHLASLKGISSRSERRAIVGALLLQTNLHEARKRPLGEFSGGMKQRFGIAQALLGKPRLLIVDEPTAGLDPEERVRFHNLLGEIGESVIVILSTHIVDDVSDLCPRFAILHRGKVLLDSEPAAAIAALGGKVWEKTIEKSEIGACSERYEVLSTRLFAGKTRLRVLADGAPDGSFQPATVDLEDVYFSTIKSAGAKA